MGSPAEVQLLVIWGKETYNITLVPANGALSLKKELEELTGVPSDRMKLMPKSKGKQHEPQEREKEREAGTENYFAYRYRYLLLNERSFRIIYHF